MLSSPVAFWRSQLDLKVFLFMHSIFFPIFLLIFLFWIGYNFFKARIKMAKNQFLFLLIIEQILVFSLYFLFYLLTSLSLFYVSYYLGNYLFLEKMLYLLKNILPVILFITIGVIFYNINFSNHNFNIKLMLRFISNVIGLFLFFFFDISIYSFSTNRNEYIFLASFFLMLALILQNITITNKKQTKHEQENEHENTINLLTYDYYLLNYFSKFNGSFLMEREYEELLLN